MPNAPTMAGQGEHHRILIPGTGQDGIPLTKQEHYLSIDAVSWYVNKESSWFTDRLVSGTLTITLAGESEKYDVSLGLYELQGGARVAPVFDRPVLPDRVFRGGTITLKAVISGLKADTKLATLIKSTTKATLGVVGGMVQTAVGAGPYAPLSTAAGDLVDGVRKILDSKDAAMQVFDPSGLEATLRPDKLVGAESYLLLHRGAELNKAKITIGADEQMTVPFFEGQPLRDGAWLLLRLRRVMEYPIERGWYQDFRKWTSSVVGLVDDTKNGVTTKEEALRLLSQASEAAPTIYDTYRKLRDQILNDGVLTQGEATGYAGTLSEYRRLAFAAIQQAKYDHFSTGIKQLRTGLRSSEISVDSLESYASAFEAASATRPDAIPTEDVPFSTAELYREVQHSQPGLIPLRHLTRLHMALEGTPAANTQQGSSP